jgi:DNA-binding CsgD family transcriptional regulator
VLVGSSQSGIVLLDSSLSAVACNPEAIRILTFPSAPDRIRRMDVFLADKIRTELLNHRSSSDVEFVKELKSGKRRYTCRAFQLEGNGKSAGITTALLLERTSSAPIALEQLCLEHGLTQRERETVKFLLLGLTSKEIATRMDISPNTVKAFLRIVMVKMGVSTRSGIVGRILGK